MIDAEITVKLIIRNACDQAYINNYKGDTDKERFSNAMHELINDEGLMGIVDYDSQTIIEIKKL